MLLNKSWILKTFFKQESLQSFAGRNGWKFKKSTGRCYVLLLHPAVNETSPGLSGPVKAGTGLLVCCCTCRKFVQKEADAQNHCRIQDMFGPACCLDRCQLAAPCSQYSVRTTPTFKWIVWGHTVRFRRWICLSCLYGNEAWARLA